MTSLRLRARPGGAARAFTLIELLVVCGIIAALTALLIPAVHQVREQARRVRAEQQRRAQYQPPVLGDAESELDPAQVRADDPPPPPAAAPWIDKLAMQLQLDADYHRVDFEIYTHYSLRCAGTMTIAHPPRRTAEPVLLWIPFPTATIEARDVELKLSHLGDGRTYEPSRVEFRRQGILAVCEFPAEEKLSAEFRFTAIGREQLALTLPLAKQIVDLDVQLDLTGHPKWSMPDDALQPTTRSGDRLAWKIGNLVSDRPILVHIPGAQAPFAKVMSLLQLLSLAVLLFGAGFWYISEQFQPGRLDRFRWADFSLLAITYSLFFLIFAVLEFHGQFPTWASMLIAGVASLPLFVLHASRIVGWPLALTRMTPLVLLTIGLAINGVYGGAMRDYAFTAMTVVLIGYVTVTFPDWRADRAKQRDRAPLEASADMLRRLLLDLDTQTSALATELDKARARLSVAADLPPHVARFELEAAVRTAEELPDQSRVCAAAAPESASEWPARGLDWLADRRRQTEALRDRIVREQQRLSVAVQAFDKAEAELRAQAAADQLRASTAASTAADRRDDYYCIACGKPTPNARFCPHCGIRSVQRIECGSCHATAELPVHVMSPLDSTVELHCTHCGDALARS